MEQMRNGVEIEQSEKDEWVMRLRIERKIDGLYRNATK